MPGSSSIQFKTHHNPSLQHRRIDGSSALLELPTVHHSSCRLFLSCKLQTVQTCCSQGQHRSTAGRGAAGTTTGTLRGSKRVANCSHSHSAGTVYCQLQTRVVAAPQLACCPVLPSYVHGNVCHIHVHPPLPPTAFKKYRSALLRNSFDTSQLQHVDAHKA